MGARWESRYLGVQGLQRVEGEGPAAEVRGRRGRRRRRASRCRRRRRDGTACTPSRGRPCERASARPSRRRRRATGVNATRASASGRFMTRRSKYLHAAPCEAGADTREAGIGGEGEEAGIGGQGEEDEGAGLEVKDGWGDEISWRLCPALRRQLPRGAAHISDSSGRKDGQDGQEGRRVGEGRRRAWPQSGGGEWGRRRGLRRRPVEMGRRGKERERVGEAARIFSSRV